MLRLTLNVLCVHGTHPTATNVDIAVACRIRRYYESRRVRADRMRRIG